MLQSVGVMVGDENGDFNPDQLVTRNEMAVVMSNLMEYNVATYSGTSPFTDVPSWAEPYVAACWTNGITAGTSATTYGGDQHHRRHQRHHLRRRPERDYCSGRSDADEGSGLLPV